jgi:hypothetical protein
MSNQSARSKLVGHGRVLCSNCGKVIVSCKCMECSKNIKHDLCDDCDKPKIIESIGRGLINPLGIDNIKRVE